MRKPLAQLQKLLRLLCHPLMLVVVSLAGILAAGRVEHEWLSVPFSLALVAVVAGTLFLATSRLAFSAYLAWMIVGVLTLISAIKFRMKGFSLHFYDTVFVSRDPEVYRFIVGSYLHLILPVVMALALGIAAAILIFRADRKLGWPVSVRAVVLAVLVTLVPLTFPAEASKDRYFYYMQGRHMSAFFVSLMDLRNLVVEPAFEQRLQAVVPQPPFADTVDCGDRATLPDIFFVLSESQSDPANFPQIARGAGFLQHFAPKAGEAHPMQVETFGGGTWITNLSLMTGLSATDFGWRSPYLTITLQDKVAGALPEILARCGYRTAVMTPMDFTFVNEGPFLRSIGFETILDIKDIAAPFYHLRDDFYYHAAEAFIAKHRQEDARPLFLEIETMFPHSPYEGRMEAELKVEGEPFSDDFQAGEYLRRMAIARGDLQAFLERREAEAGERGAVVLEFGDHQSSATKPLVDAIAGEDALARPDSLAYRTFYTLSTFNHPLRHPMPDTAPLDVAFLSASLLDAAGLPMSPMMADLVRLRDHCSGRFHGCRDRAAVDAHLRKRVDSGLLHLFPQAAPLQRLQLSRTKAGISGDGR
ncbi:MULTISPECIES: sulfatase-like hydrolase/transferase [unclassified Mesorhizobium]|uniref:sulfatase-like hydrolase/transferase n=1 Tax=unclassified Mesorhizobium TaxID=325217 RepID=UPI001CC98F21|nr:MULTISPECIES: sulfatase-like hydrolase/transferase [unclassified Mesorhizobium]MBZ9739473.1 sulfatase-like hydrolase/transferase [Mesorhizobium sp. CO1-1-4]MBZ9801577.1 sulfatase-like hydrolase/transferase [Mesorhizobium sp. ES1-6]